MKKLRLLGPLALLIMVFFTNCEDSADSINVGSPDQESITGPENYSDTVAEKEIHHNKFADRILEEDPVE